jgi:hypothetical protein
VRATRIVRPTHGSAETLENGFVTKMPDAGSEFNFRAPPAQETKEWKLPAGLSTSILEFKPRKCGSMHRILR